MGSKRDNRAQKKREKSRKKRDDARRTRGSRPGIQSPAVASGLAAAEAVRWPVGECYLSQHWHEHGPHLHAVFTRAASDGRVAVAFFELDLESGGVIDVLFRAPVSADAVLGEVARRSELSGDPIQVSDALRVRKAVEVAMELGGAPAMLPEALALFGDLDPRACEDSFLTGSPPPPPPKKKSLFTMLFGE